MRAFGTFNQFNAVEKIIQAHLVAGSASKGIVELTPKHVMTHDNSSAVILKFEEIFEKAAAIASGWLNECVVLCVVRLLLFVVVMMTFSTST
jgi:hypothetical protein